MKNLIALFALTLTLLAFNTFGATAGIMCTGIFPVGVQDWSDINRQAKEELSSYDGHSTGYTGMGDEFIDFTGNNFINEMSKQRAISFTVTSTHSATQDLFLLPGLSWNPGGTNNGLIKDGAVDGLTLVTVSVAPTSATSFLQFVRSNPTRWLGMKVSSDVTAQINQIITYEKETFERNLGDLPINMANYHNENAFKDKVVTMDLRDLNLQFDGQAKVTIPVVANSVTTFTIWCGAILNTGKALERKAYKAQATQALTAGYRG